MNNEPVAWMLVTGHGTKILEKKPYCEVDYWKPLYTHPVKELTDEEILDTFDPHFDADIEDKELIKFARAILRKAQEKC